MLLCKDEQIEKRLHVCMLVEERTVEAKLWDKYKYLLKEPDNKKSHEYQRLIRENFEKLFDVHLTLPGLKAGGVEDVLLSFLELPKEEYQRLSFEKRQADENELSESATHGDNTTPSFTEQETGTGVNSIYGHLEAEIVENSQTLQNESSEPTSESTYEPIRLSDNEKVTLILVIEKFDEPYENYMSPRSIQQLITQFLLARSLLRNLCVDDEGRAKYEMPETQEIMATILKWQGFQPKSGYNPPIIHNEYQLNIIHMVVWEQAEKPKSSNKQEYIPEQDATAVTP